jgi:hypothetical protein
MMLMIRVLLFAVLLSINLATISKVESSECARISNLASARARWAATELSHIDAAHAEKSVTTTPNRAPHSNPSSQHRECRSIARNNGFNGDGAVGSYLTNVRTTKGTVAS